MEIIKEAFNDARATITNARALLKKATNGNSETEIATDEQGNEVAITTDPATGKKTISKVTKSSLRERKAAREALFAEQKYDVTKETGEQLINETHRDHLNKEIAPATGDGGVVENIVEQQKKDLEVVNKMPRGELSASDDASITREAEVDPETKKYWRELFQGQDQPCQQFVKELTSETEQRTVVSEEEVGQKYKRAYDVALDMQTRGMIEDSKEALAKQVDAILKLDEAGFESFREAIAGVSAPMKKEASAQLPAMSVGTSEHTGSEGLVDTLSQFPWTDNKRTA
jgi:hypothetical protein